MIDTHSENREKISAFVICMNEEDQIADCLNTLSFCDEVVVIDSFSTDSTVEIAKSLGAKVIQRPWPGYREQKSFGLTVCTHSWVINIDADERVSPELRESVMGVLRDDWNAKHKGGPKAADGYFMNRVVFYLGRWWRLGGWYPEYRLRFFRRELTTWGGVEPHEKPIVQGRTEILPGELQHFTYKNLDEQLQRLHSLSMIAAREEYKGGERASLFSLLVNPALRSIKFFLLKKGYREGMAGLVVALAEGYYTFMKYAKIWELEFWEAQKKSGASGKPEVADKNSESGVSQEAIRVRSSR